MAKSTEPAQGIKATEAANEVSQEKQMKRLEDQVATLTAKNLSQEGQIKDLKESLKNASVIPEIPPVDTTELKKLQKDIEERDEKIKEISEKLARTIQDFSKSSSDYQLLEDEYNALKAKSKADEVRAKTPTPIQYAYGVGNRVKFPAQNLTARFIVTLQAGADHRGTPLYNIHGDGFDLYFLAVPEDKLLKA